MTAVKKETQRKSRYHLYYRKIEHIFGKRTRENVKKLPAVTIRRGNFCPKKYAGKELDAETGLYYYGARYLDPKISRWLSGDPAMGEYIPAAGSKNNNFYYYNTDWDVLELMFEFNERDYVSLIKLAAGT